MPCCQFTHFAGADDHYSLAGKIAKDGSGQLDRRIADGHSRLRNPGFAANFHGYRKGARHQCA
jgi:hypothetical protein